MFRQRVQLHDRSRIQKRHPIESVDRGGDRLGTRVDEDLFTPKAQGLIAGAFNFDRSRIDESRPSTNSFQFCRSFSNLFCALSTALDDLLLALPPLRQI